LARSIVAGCGGDAGEEGDRGRIERVTERPAVRGVYETVLYGSDLRALAEFYTDIVGLSPIDAGIQGLLAAFRVPDGSVLLLFDPARSAEAGREVPSHGSRGAGHVAFRTNTGELDDWLEHFADVQLPVERIVEWRPGLVSIYVRDPAGNSVEFTNGELWE
jgi:catechol-2,3-dioxygenase